MKWRYISFIEWKKWYWICLVSAVRGSILSPGRSVSIWLPRYTWCCLLFWSVRFKYIASKPVWDVLRFRNHFFRFRSRQKSQNSVWENFRSSRNLPELLSQLCEPWNVVWFEWSLKKAFDDWPISTRILLKYQWNVETKKYSNGGIKNSLFLWYLCWLNSSWMRHINTQ